MKKFFYSISAVVMLVATFSTSVFAQSAFMSASQILSIQSVYATDAKQQPKSTFSPGDAIYYHIDATNTGKATIPVFVHYEALTGESKHTYIFNQEFTLSMPVGASRFYTPATVPSDALSGAYTILADIKQNGGGAVAQGTGSFTVGTPSQSTQPQPDLNNTQQPPLFCVGGGSCNGVPSGNTGKPLPPNNDEVKKLVGLVGNVVDASDKICSIFKCKASVAVPINRLNKLFTIGNLSLAIPQEVILGQKLAALNEAIKQFGKHSYQACIAAQAVYVANRNLHETLLNVVPGLEFIFPLPVGDGPICG